MCGKICLNVFEQVKSLKLTKAAFIWSKYSKNAVKQYRCEISLFKTIVLYFTIF